MRKLVCVFAGLFMMASWAPAQTARQYYDELYKAGGLDRMTDGHVCFDDSSDLQTFFIFGKSNAIMEFLQENHGFSKLSKSQQYALKKGCLVVRGYDKGVALSSEETYQKDGDSWVTESYKVQNTPMRMRLSITWATLRYKRSVEILDSSGRFKSAYDRYGKCEVVSPEIQQKGN